MRKKAIKERYFAVRRFVVDLPRNIKWFFKNIWLFRKTLWHNRTWDYSGMLQAMDDHLSGQIKYGMSHIENSDKYMKSMKIARELVRRINEDSYHEDKVDLKWSSRSIDDEGFRRLQIVRKKKNDLPTVDLAMSIDYRKQDLEMLSNIIRKHMLFWWD